METTRHFTASAYVVDDGAVALHEHERLGLWLPPGGHVDRDELPREAARREVREETGLAVDLLEPETTVEADAGRELPAAEHLMLHDINVHESGHVGHQHIDFVYYGAVGGRAIDPADGEAAPDAWRWFTPEALREHDGLTAEVVEMGAEAVERVDGDR